MTPPAPGKYQLAIAQCPIHRTFWAVTLDTSHGGRRLTHGKCCGRWRTVKAWPIDPAELIQEIAGEAGLTVRIKPAGRK